MTAKAKQAVVLFGGTLQMKSSEQELSAELAIRQLTTVVEMSEHAVAKLAGLAKVKSYTEGTVLFHEGERHQQIYFVLNGSLKLDMNTVKCGRQTILTVGRGDLLAWSAITGDCVMTATAIVTEPTQLIAIDADELQDQLELDPVFGYQMMKILAKALSLRLLATRLQVLDIYHR